ncbi:hypothetical protein K488DRAFT_91038 [Vararia minispora EC-137]|uniref:Uncharacterized protein n=1 Tax=Vararia minispora EC-137 TaxID=1314806 RepID=A0ACB8Q674_9AGAM|nr:hypothetical protein K488DRAFT_91038 [Vararia minispora EC-137]
MGFLYIARYITLVGSLVGAVIVLGMAADILSTTLQYLSSYFIFNALAVAIASLTILAILPMLIIDELRDRAFTSLVVVELTVLTILWILWLSTGAYAVWTDSFVFGTGSCNYANSEIAKVCREWNAVIAFCFLNWILAIVYTITILVMAIIAHTNGRRGFTTTVRHGFSTTHGPVLDVSPAAPVEKPTEEPYEPGHQLGAPAVVYTTRPHVPSTVERSYVAQV